MCDRYAEIKNDFLYRGDVLRAVPFVSLDAGPISIETPEDPKQPAFNRAPFLSEDKVGQVDYPVQCVASLERVMGLVMLRTCEGNKRISKRKVFGSVLVAPIRPFTDFPIDQVTKRPFHELVAEGFPLDGTEEKGECYRFMVLAPCGAHGLPDGGMVCFREAQPVPIRHLLACEKVTRLAIPIVGVLDYRYSMFMQQSEDDDKADAAAPGPDSEIVAAFKKRVEKRQQEREAAT